MQSPYKKAIVYDLETGGLSCKKNNITEIAMVAVDLDNLEIIDEMSVMIKPTIDLREREDEIYKEVKSIIKDLAEKDPETKLNTLMYKGDKITLRNYQDSTIEEDIEDFFEMIDKNFKDAVLNIEDIKELEKTVFKDVIQLYFNRTYSPQALEVTKISRLMLESDGVDKTEAYNMVKSFINKHTVGNSKPIISGHNIGWLPRRIVKKREISPNGFDNPFMEKWFWENGGDFFDSINDVIMDTLQMSRIKWSSLSSYSLGVCANEVGLTLEEAHRALPDTIANAKYLIKLLKSLRGEGSQESKYVRRKYDFNF